MRMKAEPKVNYTNETPELPKKTERRGRWAALVDGFEERDEKCMVLIYENRYEAQAAGTGMRARIKGDGRKMRVQQSENRVYVVKENE